MLQAMRGGQSALMLHFVIVVLQSCCCCRHAMMHNLTLFYAVKKSKQKQKHFLPENHKHNMFLIICGEWWVGDARRTLSNCGDCVGCAQFVCARTHTTPYLLCVGMQECVAQPDIESLHIWLLLLLLLLLPLQFVLCSWCCAFGFVP